jgi:ribonucleoside-diphosphate reductase alpha chain
VRLGLWNQQMKDKIITANGSIQQINEIPEGIKSLYKTVWEIKQKVIIDMAADRGAFIDQSQSLNLFMAQPNTTKISSMHFYAWKKGLKTGMYYLRTQAAAQAVKFTIDNQTGNENIPQSSGVEDPVQAEYAEGASCTFDDEGNCISCSA